MESGEMYDGNAEGFATRTQPHIVGGIGCGTTAIGRYQLKGSST